ncbi:unnamed protein product [Chrysodeixis includens]|uniref:Uncharacterized protein n=1 Tax=Chrysodeixis includens TaxID=689277 RepID=A0A9N8KS74_CHRIL|nr:unnamed protein product [Chrysodeixis includens]
MVKKVSKGDKVSIKADVIVLGCTLPGIVAAHKLKRKFGDTMDIMVLDLGDLGGAAKSSTRYNVAFQDKEDSQMEGLKMPRYDHTARELLDNVARFYLVQYAKELRVPLPNAIINPLSKRAPEGELSVTTLDDVSDDENSEEERIPLQKVFQYRDAMALKPDELHRIQVEDQLLSDDNADLTRGMTPGRGKKFSILYKSNFWTKLGYSGDIFSMRGPIIWAMERPRMSTTGSLEKYSGLIGYLVVRDDDTESKEAVLEQLVKLFGDEAASPVSYKESSLADIYVPRCGDYVALRKLTTEGSPKFLEWGALDIFADGDVAAALEAGHTAYLHLLGCLRPQAQSYDDIIASDWPKFLSENPVKRWMAQVNMITGIKIKDVGCQEKLLSPLPDRRAASDTEIVSDKRPPTLLDTCAAPASTSGRRCVDAGTTTTLGRR